MTLTLRKIDATDYPKTSLPASFGKPARLEWLPIKQLVVDPEYQRDISVAGRKNVIKIALAFDWSMFAPVIVAPAGNNQYAIVDGQHRTTAAVLCGIDRVPCAIIDGARAAQAAAFAAINTVVTAMSPLQVHAAKLAAGDGAAAKLTKVCHASGVTICRYPVPSNKMKVGETLAAGKLYRLLEQYGDRTLTAALRCITQSRDGYPGLLRGQIVAAIAAVLEAEPDWIDSPDLIKAMNRIDIAAEFRAARKSTEGSNSGVINALIDAFGAGLGEAFDDLSGKANTPERADEETTQATPATETPQGRVASYGPLKIDFTLGDECVCKGKVTKKVSRRQAGLFELLARGAPNPIGRKFLCERLFGESSALIDTRLDMVVTDAKQIAAALGMKITEHRGVGIALVVP